MQLPSLRRIIVPFATATVFAALTWLAWPKPVPVDLATALVGPMDVTVDDDAKTRVRHIYTVSAPISGKVLRISYPGADVVTSLHIGDKVTAGETVVAVMQPTPPSFLDIRTKEELQAASMAAKAAVKLAEAEVRRIEAAVTFSRDDLERAKSLVRTDAISAKALDKAKLDADTNAAALASAKAQLDIKRSEEAAATARLIDPTSVSEQPATDCCVRIRAPVSGRVLSIIQDSEASVPAGAPLIEIGDPRDLEVVAELLSTDAVQISIGARVKIDGWGGEPLQGRVKRVDPAGFLKVSALGIEEQRVRTVIDLIDSADVWSRLGHDFRVVVHVNIWSAEKVLTIPTGALFRAGDDWAVFVQKGGRARSRPVQVGHRNDRRAEILGGLSEGDQVVLHPSDRIADGTKVAQRQID